MAKLSIDIYDGNTQKPVGTVELPAHAFGAPVRKQLLWEVVRQQQANSRAGTASTKKRSDVSGGGKKPWKQKHTGNARHGSTREPQWRHGGNVFGPLPRDYAFDVPRKVRNGALASALSLRAKEGKVRVLDKLEVPKPSTKTAAKLLSTLGVSGSALVLIAERNEPVELSFRNLPRVKVLPVAGLNVRDLMKHELLVLTRPAVDAVAKRIEGGRS